MPEFILNNPAKRQHPFYALDEFAKGYVEAMFFTNGDTGDEREDLLNGLGVERLTRESVSSIRHDCESFVNRLASVGVHIADMDCEQQAQAGRDLWFTRQHHGTGFWSRDDDTYGTPEIRDALDAHAKHLGEHDVQVWRGWIHA